jgi:hypothetical protein
MGSLKPPTASSSDNSVPADDVQLAGHTRKRSHLRFAICIAFIFIVTVAIGAVVGRWIVRHDHEARRLKATRDSFLLTAMSLDYYDECNNHLPFLVRRETVGKSTRTGMPNGTGKPLYSWRGEVVTYRDNWFFNMGGKWDSSAPWDSPANKQMADYPWQFCYDALVTWDWPKGYSKETSMMAITGPGTAFGCDGDMPKSLTEIPGNTILVVETRNSGIHWMQPGDFDIRTMPKTINAPDGRGISSRYPGGFHVLFADEIVWFLSDKVPFEALEKFFTIEGARKNDRQKILGPYVLAPNPPLRRPLGAYYHPDRQQVSFDGAVTDADLADLSQGQFARVSTLWLNRTQVVGPGLSHLCRLAHLEVLYLNRTQLTNEGLVYVGKLIHLTWLRLDKTKITDTGLENLKHLVDLEGLYLDHTEITDAGLEHLKGLTKLKDLSLFGTKVSSSGVKKLQQALPRCKISWNPLTQDKRQ